MEPGGPKRKLQQSQLLRYWEIKPKKLKPIEIGLIFHEHQVVFLRFSMAFHEVFTGFFTGFSRVFHVKKQRTRFIKPPRCIKASSFVECSVTQQKSGRSACGTVAMLCWRLFTSSSFCHLAVDQDQRGSFLGLISVGRFWCVYWDTTCRNLLKNLASRLYDVRLAESNSSFRA